MLVQFLTELKNEKQQSFRFPLRFVSLAAADFAFGFMLEIRMDILIKNIKSKLAENFFKHFAIRSLFVKKYPLFYTNEAMGLLQAFANIYFSKTASNKKNLSTFETCFETFFALYGISLKALD